MVLRARASLPRVPLRVTVLGAVLPSAILLASACARSPDSGAGAQVAPAPTAAAQQVAESEPADAARPAAIDSSAFLAYRSPRRLLPEDPMIGRLADPVDAPAGERAALQAAHALLQAVRSGEMDDAPLTSAAAVHVAGSIDYHLRRGVTLARYRLGEVERDGDTAFLRARLSGPAGSIAAEVYLILRADRWLVDDVQADWAALRRARGAPERIPLPRPAGWSAW